MKQQLVKVWTQLFGTSDIKYISFWMPISMLTYAPRALGAIAPLCTGYLADEFEFIFNGTIVSTTGSDATALSPAVALQLSVDPCAQRFTASGSEINSAVILSFERLWSDLHSGDSLSGGILMGTL